MRHCAHSFTRDPSEAHRYLHVLLLCSERASVLDAAEALVEHLAENSHTLVVRHAGVPPAGSCCFYLARNDEKLCALPPRQHVNCSLHVLMLQWLLSYPATFVVINQPQGRDFWSSLAQVAFIPATLGIPGSPHTTRVVGRMTACPHCLPHPDNTCMELYFLATCNPMAGTLSRVCSHPALPRQLSCPLSPWYRVLHVATIIITTTTTVTIIIDCTRLPTHPPPAAGQVRRGLCPPGLAPHLDHPPCDQPTQRGADPAGALYHRGGIQAALTTSLRICPSAPAQCEYLWI
jgi:hypothetical protein